jgi:hypothetical protein
MDVDLTRLNLVDLNQLLTKSEMELQEALLDGKSWQESKDVRDFITALRVAIHRATYPKDTTDIGQIRMKLMLSPELQY